MRSPCADYCYLFHLQWDWVPTDACFYPACICVIEYTVGEGTLLPRISRASEGRGSVSDPHLVTSFTCPSKDIFIQSDPLIGGQSCHTAIDLRVSFMHREHTCEHAQLAHTGQPWEVCVTAALCKLSWCRFLWLFLAFFHYHIRYADTQKARNTTQQTEAKQQLLVELKLHMLRRCFYYVLFCFSLIFSHINLLSDCHSYLYCMSANICDVNLSSWRNITTFQKVLNSLKGWIHSADSKISFVLFPIVIFLVN